MTEWHPYPETAPECDCGGEYLVTVKDPLTGRREVIIDRFETDDYSCAYFEDDRESCPVIAWAEIPKPFDGATPKYILVALDKDGPSFTVFGDTLAECKEKALSLFTTPDLPSTSPIFLREYYSDRLISTWIPKARQWADQ